MLESVGARYSGPYDDARRDGDQPHQVAHPVLLQRPPADDSGPRPEGGAQVGQVVSDASYDHPAQGQGLVRAPRPQRPLCPQDSRLRRTNLRRSRVTAPSGPIGSTPHWVLAPQPTDTSASPRPTPRPGVIRDGIGTQFSCANGPGSPPKSTGGIL
ncbi:hypothetical protein OH77DRAFT_617423 [Trametes cingulata]|nr:hypothetical protein OH77DRAFT_617423 [Trametes cingulata]